MDYSERSKHNEILNEMVNTRGFGALYILFAIEPIIVLAWMFNYINFIIFIFGFVFANFVLYFIFIIYYFVDALVVEQSVRDYIVHNKMLDEKIEWKPSRSAAIRQFIFTPPIAFFLARIGGAPFQYKGRSQDPNCQNDDRNDNNAKPKTPTI